MCCIWSLHPKQAFQLCFPAPGTKTELTHLSCNVIHTEHDRLNTFTDSFTRTNAIHIKDEGIALISQLLHQLVRLANVPLLTSEYVGTGRLSGAKMHKKWFRNTNRASQSHVYIYRDNFLLYKTPTEVKRLKLAGLSG